MEQKQAIEAELEGKAYSFILDASYQWANWAAPKTADGKFDHHNALTGDDLKDFVNLKLFPYLKGFKQRATGPNTIEYKIGEIFGEINNKIQSGYNLREVIERIDELSFNTQAEKHELSHLYEAKIKNMGNAGRNGGEYYTPRPLIRAMIQGTQPKIGETIYDGAVGSAGFLWEAFDYLRHQGKRDAETKLSTKDLEILQTSTFYGKEKKSLAYVIAIMNMILHGIEAPNIIHTNTLAENISDIQEKDRFDIILANPAFGGKERAEVQQNFLIKTGETAFLFLQHFIKTLRAGGRAAVVIKNTFLSNTDNASVSLRKLLLESCNLHTVLDCPSGTFQGAGVKTVVLFFEKGAPTRNTWFYQLEPGRNMGKTNPLNDADLAEFVSLQKTFADSPKSWSINARSVDKNTFDLSVKNPNVNEEVTHCSPQAIMDEIAVLNTEDLEVLHNIVELQSVFIPQGEGWSSRQFEDCIEHVKYTTKIQRKNFLVEGEYPIISQEAEFINGYWDNATDVFKVTRPVIIFGDHTQVLKYIDFNFVLGADGVKILLPKQFLHPKYFFHYLRSVPLKSLGYSRHYRLLKELKISYPPLDVQATIIQRLDELDEETQRLEAIYQRKTTLLDELKKSLLQQAFAGEL